MLGIIGATLLPINTTTALWLSVITCLLACIGLFRAWRYNALALFCACLSLGMALTTVEYAKSESTLVNYNGKQVTVVHDAALAGLAAIREAIEEQGYEVKS
jgi:competence protein ComEC